MAKKIDNKVLFVVVGVVVLALFFYKPFLGASVSQGGTSLVTRSIPGYSGSANVNSDLTINLQVSVGGSGECGVGNEDLCNDFYIIEEIVPAGATLKSVSSPCEADTTSVPNRVLCVVLDNAVSTTHSYILGLPANPTTLAFSGQFVFQGDNVPNNMGGASSVSVVTPVCVPSWDCSAWSPEPCSYGQTQSRTCTDTNTCGLQSPPVSQVCNAACVSAWVYGNWGNCVNGVQTRSASDSNACPTPSSQPVTSQSCTCQEVWTYGAWSTCVNGSQSRTATDANSCGTTLLRGNTTQSCTAGGAGGGGGAGGVNCQAASSWFVGNWSTCTYTGNATGNVTGSQSRTVVTTISECINVTSPFNTTQSCSMIVAPTIKDNTMTYVIIGALAVGAFLFFKKKKR